MPPLLALAITMSVTVAVGVAFASLVAWGFGRVGVSLLADTARYQALYERAIDGSRTEEFQSPGFGASTSMSAGSCIGRARSRAVSTPPSPSG